MGKVGISYTNRAPPLGEYQATSSLLPASLPFLICSIVSQIVSTLVTVIQMNLKGAFSVSGTSLLVRTTIVKKTKPSQAPCRKILSLYVYFPSPQDVPAR